MPANSPLRVSLPDSFASLSSPLFSSVPFSSVASSSSAAIGSSGIASMSSAGRSDGDESLSFRLNVSDSVASDFSFSAIRRLLDVLSSSCPFTPAVGSKSIDPAIKRMAKVERDFIMVDLAWKGFRISGRNCIISFLPVTFSAQPGALFHFDFRVLGKATNPEVPCNAGTRRLVHHQLALKLNVKTELIMIVTVELI